MNIGIQCFNQLFQNRNPHRQPLEDLIRLFFIPIFKMFAFIPFILNKLKNEFFIGKQK